MTHAECIKLRNLNRPMAGNGRRLCDRKLSTKGIRFLPGLSKSAMEMNLRNQWQIWPILKASWGEVESIQHKQERWI